MIVSSFLQDTKDDVVVLLSFNVKDTLFNNSNIWGNEIC